jgi:exopolyphosphatase/guanosine-5'-triphosphate,3'-diphosphate pyrophosphatase
VAVERVMTITRLGEGVDSSRRLSAAAIERTVDALHSYRELIDRHGVSSSCIRMTATSAARDAANRDDFFDAAEAVIGVRPELLAGEEEARLSFAGATAELDPASAPWVVVDVGGGSTEIIAGPGPDGGPVALASLDVGCLRISERFLSGTPSDVIALTEARAHVRRLLDAALEEHPELNNGGLLVGLAGTVSTLASIDQSLDRYERSRVHHHTLTLDRVEEILASLAAMSITERGAVPGMEAGREGVIVGGTAVLAEVMRGLGFDSCLSSEADILDGLVASLEPSQAKRPTPRPTV